MDHRNPIEKPLDECAHHSDRVIFSALNWTPHCTDERHHPFLDRRVEEFIAIVEVVMQHGGSEAYSLSDSRESCCHAPFREYLDRCSQEQIT